MASPEFSSTFEKPRRRSSLLKRFSRGSSSDDGDEKFSSDIQSMSTYTNVDVTAWDHLSESAGLKKAKEIDQRNQKYYAMTMQEMKKIIMLSKKHKNLGKSVTTNDIEQPPNYEMAFRLHRERNQLYNARLYEIARNYLVAFGYVILDLSQIGPYSIPVDKSKIVEPYNVIEKAKTHAIENGFNMMTKYKEIIMGTFKSIEVQQPPNYRPASAPAAADLYPVIPEDGEVYT